MKRICLIIASALVMTGVVCAQEYKVAKSSGRLEIIEVNHVSIEGYNGNEIVFTSQSGPRDRDARAEGLRALSSLGLEDNSGLGLSVVDKGNVIEVRQLKKTEGPRIKIMVPKGVVVSYSHSSPFGDVISVGNFEGEIQISTVHNGVVLTNTSGPTSVKTVHGNIEASLGSALTAAVKLESVHGHVDVALPVTTKANLNLSTDWGEVLVDPAFKIEIERSGDLTRYSGRIKGKLNGGGSDVTLTSNHNNIYLRKK
ncbi:MAG: hypothetical protein M3Y60_05810 [Bacteroidota bacterium]|nr:hypothetical protein [Bacteroidota bacterium]